MESPFGKRFDKVDIGVSGVSDSNARIFEMASKDLRTFDFFSKEKLSVPKNEKSLKKRKGVLGIFKG